MELFEQARDYALYIGVEAGERRFVVDARDRGVDRALFVTRRRSEIRVLTQAVTLLNMLIGDDAVTERVFVDVGASIGTTTVAALQACGFGSAVACEPEEDNHRLLRANLALNGLEGRVRSLRAAASSGARGADLVVPEGRRDASWIAVDEDKVRDAQVLRAGRLAEDPEALDDPLMKLPAQLAEMTVVDVELVTLDGLADEGAFDPGRVGMLWIDAEGHEGHVLEGAETLTERGIPVVFKFHPERLARRGDRGKVNAVAESSYTHFIDVRRPSADPTQSRFRPHPIAELDDYANRFLDSSEPSSDFTNLLLLRLDAIQARAETDLIEAS